MPLQSWVVRRVNGERRSAGERPRHRRTTPMGHPQQGQGHHYQQAGHQGGYAPVPQQQQAPVAVGAGANMKRRNPVGAWLGLPLITSGSHWLGGYYMVHTYSHGYAPRISAS